MPDDTQWETNITKVGPNEILISGYPLQELIGRSGLLEVAHLLVTGKLPDATELQKLEEAAKRGARLPPPQTSWDRTEDVSKAIARCFLADMELLRFSGSDAELTAFALGRTATYLAWLFDNVREISKLEDEAFSAFVGVAITGQTELSRLVESIIVSCVDHGVTPPSAQATIIAASARASYEVAVAHGVGAITDVHGGAGSEAAGFFSECVRTAEAEGIGLADATRRLIERYIGEGKRVKGLGHRIHTEDPRRDALWAAAEECGIAGKHIQVSKLVTEIFEEVKGKSLPINVDGVIGAVVADAELEPVMAKVLFIYGRIAGLSAHYFEEVATQRPMRRVDFSGAVYAGPEERHI